MEKGLTIMQWSAKLRTEQNRTEQNRTEQNRTEQNRTEQNRLTAPLQPNKAIKRTLWDNYVPWGALFVLSQQGGNNL